jgi:hypothetical protein
MQDKKPQQPSRSHCISRVRYGGEWVAAESTIHSHEATEGFGRATYMYHGRMYLDVHGAKHAVFLCVFIIALKYTSPSRVADPVLRQVEGRGNAYP